MNDVRKVSGQPVADHNVNGQAGFQVYTAKTLRSYDMLVHGISNRFAWGCPTRQLHQLYRSHVCSRHLEIGVGTGLFLDRLNSVSFEQLVLADPNRCCLEKAADRLKRFEPQTVELNLLEPATFSVLEDARFGSIGLNYVLHCLDGGVSNLSRFLDAISKHLVTNGVFFGSTILGTGIRPNWLAKRLMATYQSHGIFGNQQDSCEKLHHFLSAQFADVQMQQHGCVAIFTCRAHR